MCLQGKDKMIRKEVDKIAEGAIKKLRAGEAEIEVKEWAKRQMK